MNFNHQQDGSALSLDANSPHGSRSTNSPSNGSISSFGLPVVTPTVEERRGSHRFSYSTASAGSETTSPLPKVVKLDVGGFKFTTSRVTLCRVVGSHLEAMFSGRHSMEEEDGFYFIDRDGT